jgi:hypothetical protein
MDCKKAQRLFDDLSRNRLPEQLAQQVRQHLDDCTDCRVLEQRAAGLQRLLALKRYERPAPEYFDNFLDEFHHRVLTEAKGRTGLWEQIITRVEDALTVEPGRAWRYAFAGALASVLAISAVWMGMHQPDQPSAGEAGLVTVVSSPLTLTDAALPASQSTPESTTSTLPSQPEASSAGGVLVVPTGAQIEPSTPRYVLDRIAFTPVSYEVASVHF